MSTILITGANSGIGLELARIFAGQDWQVIACCRTPDQAEELKQLTSQKNSVSICQLDVSDPQQISALADELAGVAIDILFNNAGTWGSKKQAFGQISVDDWLDTLKVNTIGPMKLAEALVEQVAASERRVIATMSSVLGSIAENSSGGNYAYRSSKAAVNMVVKGMAMDLANRDIISVALHPGWVRTRIGGGSAPLSAADSARGLTKVVLELTAKDNGCFFDYQGQERPW